MFYGKFIRIIFYYKNDSKISTLIEVPMSEAKPILNRIAEKSGILVVKNKKVDLTMVNKILFEFFIDLVI